MARYNKDQHTAVTNHNIAVCDDFVDILTILIKSLPWTEKVEQPIEVLTNLVFCNIALIFHTSYQKCCVTWINNINIINKI